VLLTVGHLARLGIGAIGSDTRIYYRGSELWLAGGNAWEASAGFDGNVYHYAALPSTTVMFAPATVLPEGLFAGLWLALGPSPLSGSCGSRLGLPWWWLAFPPLAEGSGPATGHRPAGAGGRAAGGSRRSRHRSLYGAVPLGAQPRWRSLVAGGVLILATIAIAPSLWGNVRRRLPVPSPSACWPSRRAASVPTPGRCCSAYRSSPAALALLDRIAAGWVAVPAVWPASEFHYSILVLPISTPLAGGCVGAADPRAAGPGDRRVLRARLAAAGRAGWRPGLETLRRPVPSPSSGPFAALLAAAAPMGER
jgi:hypothetical protein